MKTLFCQLMTLVLLCIMNITASAQVQWALDTVLTTGANTSGIAITPDNSKIVITNSTNPGKVKIISTATYSIASIDVSSIENMPNAVAITPDGSKAFVNTLHKTIFIDLSNNTICGSYNAPCVGTSLYGIAITGNTAVYPDLSSGCTQQGLRKINTACSSASSNFILDNSGGELYGIAINNSGVSAIATGFSTHGPTNVNLSTSAVQNITGMSQSYGVATLHNSNEALVYNGDSIVRVSLSSNTVTKRITDLTFNTSFQNIAITVDDKYAFVIGAFDKKVIDLSNNTVIQTFTSGQTNVATKSDGSAFYVTDYYNGTVRVYKNITVGIDELKKDIFNATVYPNPVTNGFRIKGIEGTSELRLTDLNGKVLLTKQVTGNETITVNNLPQGMYIVKIITSEGMIERKLVKK